MPHRHALLSTICRSTTRQARQGAKERRASTVNLRWPIAFGCDGPLDFLLPAWAREESAYFQPSFSLEDKIEPVRDQIDNIKRFPATTAGRNTVSMTFLARPNLERPGPSSLAPKLTQIRNATTISTPGELDQQDYLAALHWAQKCSHDFALPLVEERFEQRRFLEAGNGVRSHKVAVVRSASASPSRQRLAHDKAPETKVPTGKREMAKIMTAAAKITDKTDKRQYLASALTETMEKASLDDIALQLLLSHWDEIAEIVIPFYRTDFRQTPEILECRRAFVSRFPNTADGNMKTALFSLLAEACSRQRQSNNGKTTAASLDETLSLFQYWKWSKRCKLDHKINERMALQLFRMRLYEEAWKLRHTILSQKNTASSATLDRILDRILVNCLRSGKLDAEQSFVGPLIRGKRRTVDQTRSSPSKNNQIKLLVSKFRAPAAVRLLRSIFPPSRALSDYQDIMDGLAGEQAIDQINVLWWEMSQSPLIKPDAKMYSKVILVNSEDHYQVASLYQEMRARRLPCSRDALTTAMNSFIFLGDFQTVSRIFTHMQKGSTARRPDLVAFNTYLKALVAAREPAKVILETIAVMKSRRIEPDARTMTLILESLADAGLLDAMELVFARIEESSTLRPNIYHFSIMVKAFFRRDRADIAFQYLAELRKRKEELGTSAIFFAQFFNALAAKEELTVGDAEQMIDNYRAEIGPDAKSDAKAIGHLVVPLMATFVDRFRPMDALRIYEILSASEGPPSFVANTTLLDAYRQAGDFDSQWQIWQQIYGNTRQKHNTKVRSNQLCFPLSIMTQSLIERGTLDDILTLWKDVQSDGFGFDNANWNDLVQAFAAFHNVEEALWLAERVFLQASGESPPNALLQFVITAENPVIPSRQYENRKSERAGLGRTGGLDVDRVSARMSRPEDRSNRRRHVTYRTLARLSRALDQIDRTVDGNDRVDELARKFPRILKRIDNWRRRNSD